MQLYGEQCKLYAGCVKSVPDLYGSRQAALEAVRQIGLRQIREMDMGKFRGMEKEAEMFRKRLLELKR